MPKPHFFFVITEKNGLSGMVIAQTSLLIFNSPRTTNKKIDHEQNEKTQLDQTLKKLEIFILVKLNFVLNCPCAYQCGTLNYKIMEWNETNKL